MAGQNVRAAPLDRSEPIESASLDELRALQLKRLKQTIARAALVPQYRKKFGTAGVTPEDFKSLNDLKALPFTTKEDLRQNYPFGMFAVPMSDVVRIHASSGTTGKPTVVGYTRGDIELWSALMARYEGLTSTAVVAKRARSSPNWSKRRRPTPEAGRSRTTP